MKVTATLLTLGLLSTGAYAGENMNSSMYSQDMTKNRILFTYGTYPELKFWYEDGRPYWKGMSSNFTYQPLIKKSFNIRIISLDDGREVAIDRRIFFPVDQAKLTDRGQRYLDEIARKLKASSEPVEGILIQGHASKPGPKAYNEELSRERAVNVKEYLVGKGVDPSLFTVESFGEAEALDSKKKSRRVKIQEI